ncbi:MAG TPA: glucuronate isomerase [Steroidobacteraceae bacterium]
MSDSASLSSGASPTPALHPDRLFPADPATRAIARRLYSGVHPLPIISPHGHTDPRWFAENAPFSDPATLLITPDHYIFRMLYSQGVRLEELGIAARDVGRAYEPPDPRSVWRRFAEHYHLFRGTPTRLWLDWVLAEVFGTEVPLTGANADRAYDRIAACLAEPAYRPRALFERFNIEVLATTESPLDDLKHHERIRASGWRGRVISAYRPDPVVDPETPSFAKGLERLGELTGEDTSSWHGYLAAHRVRRAFFAQMGATSTDHGHPTASTADLPARDAEALFQRVLADARRIRITADARGPGAARAAGASAADAELFRAQMLTEMARMSLDDGLVMQIHPGSWRNHNAALFARFGANMGADIPTRTDYVGALRPLLERFGNERALTIIMFTLDESAYSRELAPLAGHYPALRLGPAWWFHDSPEGLMRFREQTTETAGFYNTVGFNDDTRAFLSIPARHDAARRIDCAFLARLVAEHRLPEDEAAEVAAALAYHLPKAAYRL